MTTPLNSTSTINFICAYPISGQYGQAVRFLLYPLILFACFYRTHPWLAAGSLATIFTYCGVAAVHLSAMATFHSTSVLDLDGFIAFHVCVVALIICPIALQQSTSLRIPSRLLVFSVFAILLWTGVVSFAASVRFHPPTQLCFNGTSTVNINDTQAVISCFSACSQYTLLMRSGQSPQNVVYNDFFYKTHYQTTYVATCILTAWLVIGFIGANSATPYEQFCERYSSPERRSMFFHERKNKMMPHGFLQKATMLGLGVWIGYAEIALVRLPQSENSDAIGQWGPVLAFAIVGSGSYLQHFLDGGQESNSISNAERGRTRGAQTEAEIESSTTRSNLMHWQTKISRNKDTKGEGSQVNDGMNDDECYDIGLSKRYVLHFRGDQSN